MDIEERITEGLRRITQTAKDWRNPTRKELAAAQGELGRSDGTPLLHGLARAGRLGEAAHLLTSDLLQMTDFWGISVLHIAAQNGCLGQIPPNLLTGRMLARQDKRGDTPIHIAAQGKHLDQIPFALLDQAMMEIRDDDHAARNILAGDRDFIEANLMRFSEKVRAAFLAELFSA